MKKKIAILVLGIVLIVAGCCLVFGIAKKSNHNDQQETEKMNCTVMFDANGVDVVDLPKPQKIRVGDYVTEPEAPTHEDYLFIGWHTSADAVALVDTPIVFEEYSVEKDTTLYAIWESKSIDIDGDGLNYQEEAQYGTDTSVLDTDFDGLSDGDEVNVYKSDPLNSDSDNDGILDGAEISLGLNPLSPMSNNTTQDIHRQIETPIQVDEQLFGLKICATPAMLTSVSTETYPLSSLDNTEGLVSPIIQVEYDESKSFASAELSFDYSSVDLTGIDEKELTFLYLNEVTGRYEIVPSTVNTAAKTISFQPTHFSLYVVGVKAIASRVITNFVKPSISYSGDMINVSEVVATDFDVKQHGFAFHNFKLGEYNGVCYGFTMVTYLNYMKKLPLVMKKTWDIEHSGYDISKEKRFFENQLYIQEERDVFSEDNDYTLGNYHASPVFECITYWFLKQHNVRDHFFDNIAQQGNFANLKKKLESGEPVPLALWRFGVAGHSVLACGLYQSETESNVYYISIYDSNYPGEMRYIKLTRGGSLSGTNKLEYGKYTNFQLANFEIPEGPYVPHKIDISGTVSEIALVDGVETSVPVKGAKVTIYSQDKQNVIATANMDDTKDLSLNMGEMSGIFRFSLPAGEYIIEATAEGYFTYSAPLTVGTERMELPIVLVNRERLVTVAYDLDKQLPESYSECEWFFAGDYTGQIPKIALQSEQIRQVNQEIFELYDRILQDSLENNESLGGYATSICYEWTVNGDILSLLVDGEQQSNEGFSDYFVKVYHISISNGTLIDNEEILATAGFSKEEFQQKAKEILGSQVWGNYTLDHKMFYIQREVDTLNGRLERTLSDMNMAIVQPYLGENGQLCMIGAVCDFIEEPSDEFIWGKPVCYNLKTTPVVSHYDQKATLLIRENMLTEEEAYQIACDFWDFYPSPNNEDGMGFIEKLGMKERADGTSYYLFVLYSPGLASPIPRYVDELQVDAETGECTSYMFG